MFHARVTSLFLVLAIAAIAVALVLVGAVAPPVHAGSLMGTLTQTSPTTLDICDGSYIGSFSVPEPNTLVMAAPALAIGSMVVFRRRRSEMKHLPG